MDMINVLNRLTELSKENDSPDVKQAMENTKRMVGDRNAVVVEEHIVEGVNEVITKKTPAGEIISDFQKSKNKKFKGKSKAERQNMALGAYYGMHPEKSRKAKMGETKLTPKQMKIAGAADPKNKITGADFSALRKGKTVESSLAENTELAAMKKLAGLNECGAMMGSMAPHTPANISINASAASGTEVASMLRDLMKLAGDAADKPEIAVVSSEPMDTMGSMDSMEGMVDEEAADGHFADATTEPAGPAGAVYDENPVVSMTGRQVQTPNGNARQNDNPLEESLWNKFQAEKKSSLVQEAEYHGKNVPLNKKLQGDVKKSKVYVKKPNGKVVKVNFGDPNMRIKKSNPKRRKSFRARHRCENPGPKWKARYWSCKSW